MRSRSSQLIRGGQTTQHFWQMATQVLSTGLKVAALTYVIAFVGLVAPHMARRLIGADHRMSVHFSCVLGALLLLASDTIGRVIIGTGSLPVGVITSCLGAPMFLYLLVKSYR